MALAMLMLEFDKDGLVNDRLTREMALRKIAGREQLSLCQGLGSKSKIAGLYHQSDFHFILSKAFFGNYDLWPFDWSRRP